MGCQFIDDFIQRFMLKMLIIGNNLYFDTAHIRQKLAILYYHFTEQSVRKNQRS